MYPLLSQDLDLFTSIDMYVLDASVDMSAGTVLFVLSVSVAIAIESTMPVAVSMTVAATVEIAVMSLTTAKEMEMLRTSDGRAGRGMSDGTSDQNLHLLGDVAHGGGSDDLDRSLHGYRELLMHRASDVLDSGLGNADKCLLHDWVFSEEAEVGFGNDFELHPGNLAEHDRQLRVQLQENENTILVTEAFAKVNASDVILFTGMQAIFDHQEEAIERGLEAVLVKSLMIPDEAAVHEADNLVEVDVGVHNGSIEAMKVGVKDSTLKFEFNACLLDQKLLALSG